MALNEKLKVIICCCCFFNLSISQQLHHEMMGAQGGSVNLDNSYTVRFSVGQQSVTGTSSGSVVVQQGFQQSNWNKIIEQNTISIVTTVYPNPFVDSVKFSFSKSPGKSLDVVVFDLLGRLVYSNNIINESNQISIDLKNLSSAEYFVKISANNYIYSTKIIKQ